MNGENGKKRKRESSSSDSSDSDDDSEAKGPAKKVSKSEVLSTSLVDNSTPKNQNAPFRRVHSEKVLIKNPALRDNSYQSFDTWGAKANKDLIITQGKS